MGFKESLAIGKQGEALLNKYWTELVPTDGRTGDFMLGASKVEVKSDSYRLEDTPNMFLEKYSDIDRQTPGSIWQAREHGCSVFVYFYPADLTAYVFNIPALIAFVEGIEASLQVRRVKNSTWTTLGYLLPRSMVKHLATVKVFNGD